MSNFSRARIVVIGAGVLGLATAAVLGRRGARVTVVDDSPPGSNASAIAAGMIAPGLEAGLEGGDPERAELYRRAAGLWPGFAAAFGLDFLQDGADWLGQAQPLESRLETLSIPFRRMGDGLHLPGEGRVSTGVALARLIAPFEVVRARAERVEFSDRSSIVLTNDHRLEADAVVVAAGWRAPVLTLGCGEASLGRVTPVKGQLLVLEGGGTGAVTRTVRNENVYLVPAGPGVIVGATMEPGVSDGRVDPSVIDRLRQAAIDLRPELAAASVRRAVAGVRGAAPDGLPIAGALPAPGLFAATPPRRNGWLLAPMVAEVVAAAIAGETDALAGTAFRPDRFGPA